MRPTVQHSFAVEALGGAVAEAFAPKPKVTTKAAAKA